MIRPPKMLLAQNQHTADFPNFQRIYSSNWQTFFFGFLYLKCLCKSLRARFLRACRKLAACCIKREKRNLLKQNSSWGKRFIIFASVKHILTWQWATEIFHRWCFRALHLLSSLLWVFILGPAINWSINGSFLWRTQSFGAKTIDKSQIPRRDSGRCDSCLIFCLFVWFLIHSFIFYPREAIHSF